MVVIKYLTFDLINENERLTLRITRLRVGKINLN